MEGRKAEPRGGGDRIGKSRRGTRPEALFCDNGSMHHNVCRMEAQAVALSHKRTMCA